MMVNDITRIPFTEAVISRYDIDRGMCYSPGCYLKKKIDKIGWIWDYFSTYKNNGFDVLVNCVMRLNMEE